MTLREEYLEYYNKVRGQEMAMPRYVPMTFEEFAEIRYSRLRKEVDVLVSKIKTAITEWEGK